MKSVFNISGNLSTLLASIIAGNISIETVKPVVRLLYFWFANNGNAWAFADGGYNITIPTPFSGNPVITFDGTSMQWERPTIQNNAGPQDSKADLVCYPNIDAGNVSSTANTFFTGAQSGLFDGSVIYIFRYFYSQPQNVMGLVKEFVGWIGQIKTRREKITMEVNSIFHQLNLRIPKRMYTPACTHALYDAGCQVNKSAFTYTFSISSIDVNLPQQVIHVTPYAGSFAQPPGGSFSNGTVTFTSGLNIGLTRTVRIDVGGGIFWLANTLPNTPAINDQLNASFGCDKTLNTCITKFNAFYQFNGFPFIPHEQILF
jgi:uncharacterized phage protein (TIGR02218 family)